MIRARERSLVFIAVVVFCALAARLVGQNPSPQELYRQLNSVGLDPSQVYVVRDAYIQRGEIHISLDNGVIAFTKPVEGRITGAFFSGEGEVLLMPPDRVERISMALFTGSAILEEKFTTAYFRFNDDVRAELASNLQLAEDPESFISRWDATAQGLAQTEALRLLESYLSVPDPADKLGDHLLRARLGGTRKGTVDVFYDTRLYEQIGVGQMTYKDGASYYDIWTSFPTRRARELSPQPAGVFDRIHIGNYRIKSEVKPPTDLEAQATLNFEVVRGGDRVVIFELSRFLKVSSVTANGSPVEFLQNEALEGTALARRGDDLVAVVFPQALARGQKLEMQFVYAGSVLSDAGGGLMYVGARGAWYPHRSLGMASYDLEFRYPTDWTLVATGKRVSQQTAGNMEVSHWVSERPIPLAGFNLGQYTQSLAKAGSVTVASYAARAMEDAFPKPKTLVILRSTPVPGNRVAEVTPNPLNPSSNSERVAEESARTIEFFSKRFGPFPYSSLVLSQMPGSTSQGWPGLVFLSSWVYLSQDQRKQAKLSQFDSVLYSEVVPAHEIAHQWWGDLVLWNTYRDQWISEALANYSALLTMEKDHPEDVREILEKYRHDLLEKDREGNLMADAGPVSLGIRLSSSRFPRGFDGISYGRGTWLFHMLRNLVRDPGARKTRGDASDEPFLQVLHNIVERYGGRELTGRDLQKAFEEVLPQSSWYEGHKSLDWFFDHWVNDIAVPRLELDNVKFVRKGGTAVVTGQLLQKDAPSDLVTCVPIYAAIPGRPPMFVGRVFADGEETSFRFTVSAAARKLLVDPEQTILTRP